MSLSVFQGPVKRVTNNLVINIFRFSLSVFSDRGKKLCMSKHRPNTLYLIC